MHENPLYTIKIVSIIVDYVLAAGAGLLVYELAGKDRLKAGITYSVVILLPTVILNSSGWAHCDSIYAAFFGRPLWSIIDTYSGQTEENIGFLTKNMANIYAFMPDNGPLLGNIFMGFCIAGMGLVLLYMMMKNVRIDRELLLNLVLWIILWVIFLMPRCTTDICM